MCPRGHGNIYLLLFIMHKIESSVTVSYYALISFFILQYDKQAAKTSYDRLNVR